MPCMRCGLQLIALALFAGCGAGREQRVAVSAPMVIVASFHKSLTGLMQTSIVLVQGERIDMERLQLALDGFETTSTSALLLASMDATRRAMALHGEEHLGRALELSRRSAEAIGAIPGVRLVGPELDGRPGVAGRD